MNAKIIITGIYELDSRHYPTGITHQETIEIDKREFEKLNLPWLPSITDRKINVEVELDDNSQ